MDKKDTRCHGMLLIEYDYSSLGRAYWILKNSWGVDWEINGYMYLLRKKFEKQMYDIHESTYFPIIRGID
jgi:C1A family cysteine protease